MGGLPDAVRTHFTASENKENVLLATLLLHNNDLGVKVTQHKLIL